MLNSVEWSVDRDYKTGSENEPIQFYIDALCNSKSFDLLLGYFSSSAINVLSIGFASFLYCGGTMRMVINNILSEQDKDAIKKGLEGNIDPTYIKLDEIKSLRKTLDEYGKHFFECFSWLIANKRIQVKIIQPKSGKGISHYKSGIFNDGINKVGFKASCNFTAYGLLENLEELDSFLTWENGRSNKWINAQSRYFNEIFEGRADFVEYLEIDTVLIAIRSEFGDKSLNELLAQEKYLIEKRNKLPINERLKRSLKAAYKKVEKFEEIELLPKFPFGGRPREYQTHAYNNWVNNDFKGIFAMATGTGKTITSLNCLLQEMNRNNMSIYHCLILVPTITLVNQWEDEARKFNFFEVVKVSSKVDWESELATTLSTAKRIPTSFVIITTYASFVKERFLKYLKELPSDTLFIADEAHNIGSKSVLNSLERVNLPKRIGLSATPKRIYDLEGSIAMERFFNDKEPYTYSFSMERAIEEGILCKYYYYPHIISLTDEELIEYIEITKKLAKFYNNKSGNLEENDIVEKLLLKRKRIIHKAINKLSKTREILEARFKKEGNLNYTFIYVPEGNTQEITEDDNSDEESIKIINQYTREVGKIDKSIKVNQFVSGMVNRNDILDQFKAGKIHVIASMKCLDEGVDIPRAEHAIFCSSTGNPRQFIQRRGRVLRTHSQKYIAIIHDLIVVPDLSSSNKESDTFRVERSLVEKELERVMYFASLAINPFETENVFSEICKHYDLNIYTIHNKLKNND
ncbi:DEAD/DEAH box helicase family protein [Emticicia fluvialis]|uniref:DEAD/DEAH box helicase family protein n=1 Tax=Emticicia fluvialis TaxID=2974474 RepID=UPI0021653508|nr:DEAD/DEAH box helicase family protein [Emticicia fluvialis]